MSILKLIKAKHHQIEISESDYRLASSQLLPRDKLAEQASQIAKVIKVKYGLKGKGLLYRNFNQQSGFLRSAYLVLAEAARNNEPLTPGAEWLLDNNHVINDHILSIKKHLPKKFYGALPKLVEGQFKDYPRIYLLAFEYIAHTDGIVSADFCTTFISTFQEQHALTIGELWAFPLMLRLALIQRLQILTAISLQKRQERKLIDAYVEKVLGTKVLTGTELLEQVVSNVNQDLKNLRISAGALLTQLRIRGATAYLSVQWLEEKCRELNIDIGLQTKQSQTEQASNQISIGNTVTSLNTIASIDWKVWFENLSKVDAILQRDPENLYSRSDFQTRDRARKVIEALASKTQYSEIEIAEEVLNLCKTNSSASSQVFRLPGAGSVLYILLDQGLSSLEKSVKFKPSISLYLQRFVKKYSRILYFSTVSCCTIFLTSLVTPIFLNIDSWLSTLLILIWLVPASELAIRIMQWLFAKIVGATVLPRFDFSKSVPDDCKCVVAVHVMLDSKDSIQRAVSALEVRYLGNRDNNLYFALLADFWSAKQAVLKHDEELFNFAQEAIQNLNQRYPSKDSNNQTKHFHVLFRKRTWVETESEFMGWERKRGKIMEFNRLLNGHADTSFIGIEETFITLKNTRYVITLDADSQLPPNSAQKLLGIIAHPLNQPVFDEKTGVVKSGYTVVQPAVNTALPSALRTSFAYLNSGDVGLDPYSSVVSETYQDLFGEGLYLGKGIYDVKAFEKALTNRVPEESLLSHDLFEGLFARVALASDLSLIDDTPSKYNVHVMRMHRWIRGDWQLLPWIFGKIPDRHKNLYKTPLSLLSRWKLVDNLRRSLVVPSLLAIFLILFSTLSISQLLLPVIILTILLAWPLIVTTINALLHIDTSYSLVVYISRNLNRIVKSFLQLILAIAFIPFEAYLSLHAIIITLYRLFVSKKKLLDWQTADFSERTLGQGLSAYLNQFLPALTCTTVGLVSIAIVSIDIFIANLAIICPIVALWIMSPFFAFLISKPFRPSNRPSSRSETDYLNNLGFDTWLFFEEHITAENNYLMPDNLQIVPEEVVARRTSPTNIGLSVLAVISAYDLGYYSLPNVLQLLQKMAENIAKLETHHGHLLNWYSTENCQSLNPRYVSFVDSGNFVAFIMAARSAIKNSPFKQLLTEKHCTHLHGWLEKEAKNIAQCEIEIAPLISKLQEINIETTESFESIYSLFEIIGKTESKLQDFLNDATRVRNNYRQIKLITRLQRSLMGFKATQDLFVWYPLLKELNLLLTTNNGFSNEQVQSLSRSINTIDKTLSGRELSLSLLGKVFNRLNELINEVRTASISTQLTELLEALNKQVALSQATYQNILDNINYINSAFNNFINQADFLFLYNSSKDLFYVGYHVDHARFDNSHYDLLASEARLSSLVAVALGHVGQKHWFTLRRSFSKAYGQLILLSWSGTMFEYLMPLLLARDYAGTLLAKSNQAVVNAQRRYGSKRSVPWGVSESGYSGVDFHKNYQYKAFGVPGLGLKRGLVDDLVISPYSAGLALMVDFKSAYQNLKFLESQGARGQYGFYEAIDYTAERLSEEEKSHIVQSFLAHHQGMILIAIANVLNDGIFQNRFHSDPNIQAFDILLHEKAPDRVTTLVPHQAELSQLEIQQEEERGRKTEVIRTAHTVVPRTRLLSNGRYSVMLDNSGSGHSFFNGQISINRWREDAVNNSSGIYFYIKDLTNNNIWSAGFQPTQVEASSYDVTYNPDRVEYNRNDQGILTHCEVVISPEDDLEIRRITITNTTNTDRSIELTSYAEIALAPTTADSSHPAFSKMFIESEFWSDFDALVLKRRARSDREKELFMFHQLTLPICWAPTSYDSARGAFLGRYRSVQNPHALQQKDLSNSAGLVLDPITALRTRLEIKAGSSAQACFMTGITDDPKVCAEVVRKYHDLYAINRAFELAWSQSNVELRHPLFSVAQTMNFQHLANCLFFNVKEQRADNEFVLKNRLSQSGFWRFGISGDLPIVLVRLADPNEIKLAQELLLAHEYLRLRGLRFDLVLFNEYPGGYFQDFQNDLEGLIRSSVAAHSFEKNAGVFLRSRGQLSEDEINLLFAYASVVLSGRKGALASQLQVVNNTVTNVTTKKGLFSYLADNEEHYEAYKVPKIQGSFDNQLGCFTNKGKEYSMVVSSTNNPPTPWCNVVANPHFGFLVTESGAGYTWSDNSRENRLTPWSNDAVTDRPGEVIYIRDKDTGAYWCPTPRPVESSSEYLVKHSYGFSEFSTQVKSIFSRLTLSASQDDKAKIYSLKLTNCDYIPRTLECYFYVEWVLGILREKSTRLHVSSYDKPANALKVINYYNNEFSGRTAFISSNLPIDGYTSNRMEFIGRNRDVNTPIFLEKSVVSSLTNLIKANRGLSELSNQTGCLLDSCGLIRVSIDLEPAEEKEIIFVLGEASTSEHAAQIAKKYNSPSTSQTAIDATLNYWDQLTSQVHVETPDPSFNILLNGWLVYQNLSCRIWGRSAFYQSGGAFGFRDQLQDSLALLWSQPTLTRSQILLHASRQFVEGDVQHWWHPPTGRGVRTRISDDYLWLPYVVDRYIDFTSDQAILDEQVSFIEGPHLEANQHDIYITPHESKHAGSIYEHCVIAIDRALNFGPHGLPLIGGGDWNDGMNEVGIHGKGESVWLAWFLYDILNKFAPIVLAKNDNYRYSLYKNKAESLQKAVEEKAWDGEWYLRAFFDDGTPLGSKQNVECQIDSLSQSWGVITGGANLERVRTAMHNAYEKLVRKDSGIICLLTPPFNKSKPSPGYIQGYLPGIRENGGQYTHAASWFIWATALLGEGTKAHELFSLVNPINHTRTKNEVQRYMAEPYVFCGDVYSVPPLDGRAGWSWYTGSSAWMYRVALEAILGIKISGQKLYISPCIPREWQNFKVSIQWKNVKFDIKVINLQKVERGVKSIVVSGTKIDQKYIDLKEFENSEQSSVSVDVELGF